jgi:hypothetical protein
LAAVSAAAAAAAAVSSEAAAATRNDGKICSVLEAAGAMPNCAKVPFLFVKLHQLLDHITRERAA